jgi:hypothetical protein
VKHQLIAAAGSAVLSSLSLFISKHENLEFSPIILIMVMMMNNNNNNNEQQQKCREDIIGDRSPIFCILDFQVQTFVVHILVQYSNKLLL